MSDVFISYSRRDQEAVTKIQKALSRRRIDYWIDKEDIGTGSRWDIQIEEGIQDCKIVLIILSEHSVDSQNVGDEWGYSLEKEKHIIPVLIGECEVPMRIASLQRIECVPDFEDGLEKLLVAVQAQLGKRKSKEKPDSKPKINLPFAKIWSVSKAAGFAALLMFSIWMGYDKFLSHVDVENVNGWNVNQTVAYLESKQLKVISRTYEYSTLDENAVIKTEPVLGEEPVKRFSEISLVISKEKIVLPDVSEMERNQAVKILEQELGLTNVVVVKSIRHWTKDYGKIIAMEPAAGSKVIPNQRVEIDLAYKGGWVYLQREDKGTVDDIVKVQKHYKLRKNTDSSSDASRVDILKKNSLVKILQAQENGWYFVREIDTNDV